MMDNMFVLCVYHFWLGFEPNLKFCFSGAVSLCEMTRVQKNTFMGRDGPTAKTKTVLKMACKTAQTGNMQNLTNPNFLYKNHPIVMMVNDDQ